MTAMVVPAAAAPKIALVLSGGGARGLAQIGCLKALDEAGIRPTLIVATSMGALVGSLYCAGYTPDSIARFARATLWNDVFANNVTRRKLLMSQKLEPVNYLLELRLSYNFDLLLPNSLSHGQIFYDLLTPLLIDRQYQADLDFDRLPVPLRIIATDIVSGKQVVFSKGSMVDAVRASCGIPLAFSPFLLDSMLLLDGGLSTNIPVEIARRENPDLVLAVDVTSPLLKATELDNPVRLMNQVIGIGIERQKRFESRLADVLITPDLEEYTNTDFSAVDTVIARGYRAMRQHLDTIRTLIARVPPKSSGDSIGRMMQYDKFRANKAGRPFGRVRSGTLLSDTASGTYDPGVIRGITVVGNDRTALGCVQSYIKPKTGDTAFVAAMTDAMGSLYATNLFQKVAIAFDTANVVQIRVEEKKYWRMRLGLRFDEYNLGEGYLEPAYENLFGWGVQATAHLQYGLRREKYAFELQGNHPFGLSFTNKAQAQVYIARERILVPSKEVLDTTDTTNTRSWIITGGERSLRKGGLLVVVGTQIGTTLMLDGGFRTEQYHVAESEQSVLNEQALRQLQNGLQYFMVRLSFDNTDRFPFPQNGQQFSLVLGTAPALLNSGRGFNKMHVRVSDYFAVARNHTITLQLQGTYTPDTLPEIERSYLGGTIPEERYRDLAIYSYIPFVGLRPRTLWGDNFALLHGGYDFTIQNNLHITACIDWGYAWNNDTIVPTIRKAPVGIGLGGAYETMAGPVRAGWGRLIYNESENLLSENIFYFSAGYDF